MKQIILDTITDMCRDLLYYNRKDDEELPRWAIEKALEEWIITKQEIVEHFSKSFDDPFHF